MLDLTDLTMCEVNKKLEADHCWDHVSLNIRINSCGSWRPAHGVACILSASVG